MRTASPLFTWLGSVLCLACSGMANAGDLLLHEYAADHAGLGNVGVVARVQGPATVAGGTHGSAILSAPQPGGLPPAHGTAGAPARADMRTPPAVSLSLYQSLDTHWALLASAGWQEWSAFRRVGIELDADHPVPATSDRNYRDIWRVAVGAQYRQTPDLLWQAGLGYDSAAVVDRLHTFDTPLASSWRLAAGLTYAFDQDAELNFSYAYVKVGEAPNAQSNGFNERMDTSDEFSNAGIHVMSFSITWRY